jgi:uncharacterized membrane protein YgcG
MSFNPASSRFHELEVEAADRDAARIAARRARMAERTDRLLDARSRTVGMDYAALEAQIAEKQRAEAARKAAERAEVEETARHMALAKAVEEETRAHRAAAAAAASAALTEQAASRSLRTTGDLEGWRRADDAGMRIREDRDARGLDPDPRLGPGSAQVFDGEDPHKPDRIRLQRAQVAAWAEEAAAERAARAAEAAEAARASHAALRETVQYAEALEDASAEARRRRATGVAADNLKAAEARRAVQAAAAAEGRAAEAASLLTTTQRGAGERYRRSQGCLVLPAKRRRRLSRACLECEAVFGLVGHSRRWWLDSVSSRGRAEQVWPWCERIPLPHTRQQPDPPAQFHGRRPPSLALHLTPLRCLPALPRRQGRWLPLPCRRSVRSGGLLLRHPHPRGPLPWPAVGGSARDTGGGGGTDGGQARRGGAQAGGGCAGARGAAAVRACVRACCWLRRGLLARCMPPATTGPLRCVCRTVGACSSKSALD